MMYAIIFGVICGGGALLLVGGLVPRPLTLGELFDALDPGLVVDDVSVAPSTLTPWEQRLGAPVAIELMKSQRLVSRGIVSNLAICQMTIEAFGLQVATNGVALFAFVPCLYALVSFAGIHIPFTYPLVGAFGLAALGCAVPFSNLASKAAKQRSFFCVQFATFISLTVSGMSAGLLKEPAMEAAGSIGSDWAFGEINNALVWSRSHQQQHYVGLARLAERFDLEYVSDVARSLQAAGSEGAKVRETLLAKAQSLQARVESERRDAENERSQALAIAGFPILIGFLILLLYPALARLTHGLVPHG